MYISASACWAGSGCWAGVGPCFCVWHACSQVSLHLSEQVCLCLADNSGGNGAQTNNSERLIPLIMNVRAKPLCYKVMGHLLPYRRCSCISDLTDIDLNERALETWL